MSTLNKVLALMIDPTVRNIVGQLETTFAIGPRTIFVADLSALSQPQTALFANLLLAQITTAHVYLDGLAPYSPRALANLLGSHRSVDLVMAHRVGYLAEPDRSLVDALLGAVGTLVAFRLGPTDAERLRREFPPDSLRRDLLELSPYTAHVRTPERTYADLDMPMTTGPRFRKAPKEIRTRSRRRYASQRRQVEECIERRYSNGV